MKPAWEPIILARKPGPMRELGIEECRIGWDAKGLSGDTNRRKTPRTDITGGSYGKAAGARPGEYDGSAESPAGRWPANLILECTCEETREGTVKTNSADSVRKGIGVLKHGGENARPQHSDTGGETIARRYGTNGTEPVRVHTDPNCPCAMLDGQTGGSKSTGGTPKNLGNDRIPWRGSIGPTTGGLGDSGGASRFFYCAKASRSERNAGCEGLEPKVKDADYRQPTGDPLVDRIHGCGAKATNHHPCVKPVNLMRWLVRLVAQPGDVVLDPFMGSGTTGVACVMEGREFIGIEREAEYLEIARRRIDHASAQGRLPLDESPPLPPVAGRPT